MMNAFVRVRFFSFAVNLSTKSEAFGKPRKRFLDMNFFLSHNHKGGENGGKLRIELCLKEDIVKWNGG